MDDRKIEVTLFRRLLILAAVVIGLVLFSKLLFDALLPFTVAFFAALLLSPLSRRIGTQTRMPLRILRVITLLFFVGILASLLILGSIRLIREAKDFFLSFYDRFDLLLTSCMDWLSRWEEKLPVSNSAFAEELAEIARTAVKNAMTELSSRSASYAAKLASKLPSLLFAFFIFFLSLFYFSYDYERITAYLISLIPPRFQDRVSKMRDGFFSLLKRYLRAYSLLFLITFSELFIAFLFLRVDYAALLALTAAALDLLPAIGVGILMIPWAMFLFISGHTGKGLAVLAIYGVITLLRQIIEPHIVGAHFGIHPLASLVALYLGFRIFGFPGIFFSPVIALTLSHCLTYYRKKIGTLPKTDQSSGP